MKRIYILSLMFYAQCSYSGAFVFAGEANGIDIIAHPSGYSGSSAVLNVGVCIDPSSEDAIQMVIPVKNIIATFNQLQGTNNNVSFGNNNNIPSSQIDWESVTLHEVGHCIGLAHPNLGSQTGVSGPDTNYTNATDGINDSFDLDDGPDNIIGSADDIRGDDQNLFWFNDDVNNPFIASPPYDTSNYTRELADLPGGDNWVINPDLNVASDMGFANTEAVMQQGSRTDEDQRALGIDDESSLRLAMSGLDEAANTSDDYTINLVYGGLDTDCDINIYNDPDYTGFAVCSVGGTFVGGNHVAISTGDIKTNTSVNWFFNDQVNNDLIFAHGFE